MGDSYRIKTELGINKSINIQLDQEFEFLEILSLKIQQTDIYTRSCADYGVIVGRVTANNGLGVPNARVSVFIPIEQVDESNPLISSIYPYKSPTDKNDDGYRYNLLPYEPSYSKHSATGTLPTRSDVLTDDTAVTIYDKYYRFTSKTNESGDYMIMGVPLGDQTIVMDVDLSDIGEFSLTPQDLVRIGLATESQVGGSFRSSNDLTSLPQIINLTKNAEISPLWGDPEICQISINRLDFDLRDDANIDIQPTSVFMGSMFSSPDNMRVRKNCRPRDNMGNLCGLTTSPGQIICIRQTIQQDEGGNPVLEEYELEQGGNIIDGSGSWLTELPMNLDYLITNEFGEKVVSNDPSVGIPTRAKYRFKVKWSQPNDLTLQNRRANYLIPNVKEYGWTNSNSDPTFSTNQTVLRQQQSSYYFGLDWSGYTNGFTGTRRTDRLNEVIDGQDTFYEFKYNRVYTISSLIDQYKKGAKGRFIGIKEIDDDECESTINKFPVNDGFRNFDLLFFLFSVLMLVIQPIGLMLLATAHILLFLYNLVLTVICLICKIKIPIIKVRPFKFICRSLGINCDKRDFIIRLPMITYPDCQACDCKQDVKSEKNREANLGGEGVLSYLSSPDEYYDLLASVKFSADTENGDDLSIMTSEAIGGMGLEQFVENTSRYKVPLSQELIERTIISNSLPIGERVNLFNQRNNYFEGKNKIKVTFAKESNIGKHHYDNTLTVLAQDFYEAGTLLSFVNPTGTTDTNYLYSADTIDGVSFGISGQSYNGSGATTVNVSYATTQTTNSTPVNYNLPYGSDNIKYQYPSDIEYYQVVTAITVSDAAKIWNKNTIQSFGNVLYSSSQTIRYIHINPTFFRSRRWDVERRESIVPYDYFQDSDNQFILILQRGVDPYSPKYVNEYRVGNLFGVSEDNDNWTFTAETRINIPIQRLEVSNMSVQPYNQDGMYYQSYFYKPGIDSSTLPGQTFTGYTTTNTAYYGSLDATSTPLALGSQISGVSVKSRTDNGFYNSLPNSSKYDLSEDLSGMGVMRVGNLSSSSVSNITQFDNNYYTKTFFSTNPILTIGNRTKNILRTDRLPSSDGLDGGSWTNNPALLQQNNNFEFYIFSDGEANAVSRGATLGADIPTVDIEGLPNQTTIFQSFECENMVGLKCYKGFGSQFEINQSCADKDAVERGCYMFMRKPLIDLVKDWRNFGEWAYRFRFFYGICRGVLSQSFVNNWINGALYMFPIQVDTFYNRQNKVSSQSFCRDVVYFNNDSNNFYYRSSPYNDNSNRFIGSIPSSKDRSVNATNLLFPTTVIDLGMKDYFYSEITFDPTTKGYIIPNLNPTSYGDVSDLINLFVISRITDETFLGNIIQIGDSALQQLFTRPQSRIDGDLAQLMSINSEIGNINFSPEYYNNIPGETNQPTTILGTAGDPTIAVWFSSTTEDLQVKDFLTPGRINFRGPDNNGYYPYPYGIKSQVVPFYQWKLDNTNTIFGNQLNNWATTPQDIIQNKRYQSLDRFASDTPYFYGSNFSSNDLNARGYIFNVNGTVGNGQYTTTGALKSKFLVGAPFHFYFGAIKGETALDKFKTKYSVDE